MNRELECLRQDPDGISCRFPALTENVEIFIAGVHDFLVEQDLGGLAFDMELLAREALVNAVLHGSGGDSSKLVAAGLSRQAGALVLTVEDQGQGFDWRSLSRLEPDPSRESGRGLFIIRKYADSFEYNDKGNALRISKRVPTEVQDMNSDTKDGVVRLMLGQRVAAQDVPALRERLRELIQTGARQLELDCSLLESLDSMGIGLLVATHNSLAKQGGTLHLSDVPKDIHQLLCLMRLDKHIAMVPAQKVPA